MNDYYSNQRIQDVFEKSEKIVFLTGAGVSTDSGIPDFQTVDEDWPFVESRMDLIHRETFHRDRNKFWEAYRYIFLKKTENVWAPNRFHKAVAGLESKGKQVIVLTQNVDGLHHVAGSTQILEMHGNIREVICNRPSCGYVEPMTDDHNADSRCPKCNKFLRPNTVLFGESPRGFGDALAVSIECDLMVAAGTSLEVGPVNELPLKREWYTPEAPSMWVNRTGRPQGYTFTHDFVGELDEFSSILEEL